MFEFGPLLISDNFWSKTRGRLGVSQVDPTYLEVLAGVQLTTILQLFRTAMQCANGAAFANYITAIVPDSSMQCRSSLHPCLHHVHNINVA